MSRIDGEAGETAHADLNPRLRARKIVQHSLVGPVSLNTLAETSLGSRNAVESQRLAGGYQQRSTCKNLPSSLLVCWKS